MIPVSNQLVRVSALVWLRAYVPAFGNAQTADGEADVGAGRRIQLLPVTS